MCLEYEFSFASIWLRSAADSSSTPSLSGYLQSLPLDPKRLRWLWLTSQDILGLDFFDS